MSWILRAQKSLAEMDICTDLARVVTYLPHVVLAMICNGVLDIALGDTRGGGFSKFYREDHTRWAVGAARMLFYFGLRWFFDLHWVFYQQIDVSIKSYTPAHWRRATSSGPVSVAVDRTYQSYTAHMALDRKGAVFPKSPLREDKCDKSTLSREGHMASKLPATTLIDGSILCRNP